MWPRYYLEGTPIPRSPTVPRGGSVGGGNAPDGVLALWPASTHSQVRVFEGTAKRHWLEKRGISGGHYCHSCREPVSNPGTHCGWWDHVCLHFFVYIFATFPSRQWSTHRVVQSAFYRRVILQIPSSTTTMTARQRDAKRRTPFGAYAASTKMVPFPRDGCGPPASDRLAGFQGRDDQRRRNDLRAVLHQLADPSGPVYCLRGSLGGGWGDWSHNGNGERYFRRDVAELVLCSFPPMNQECHTRVCQKAWGRKNLTLLHDVLRVPQLQRELFGALHGGRSRTDKNSKGALMRQLVTELHFLQYYLRDVVPSAASPESPATAIGALPTAASLAALGEQSMIGEAHRRHAASSGLFNAALSFSDGSAAGGGYTSPTTPPPPTRLFELAAESPRITEQRVALVLVDLALQGIAFELVYLMSQQYMQRTLLLVEERGFPTAAALANMGYK